MLFTENIPLYEKKVKKICVLAKNPLTSYYRNISLIQVKKKQKDNSERKFCFKDLILPLSQSKEIKEEGKNKIFAFSNPNIKSQSHRKKVIKNRNLLIKSHKKEKSQVSNITFQSSHEDSVVIKNETKNNINKSLNHSLSKSITSLNFLEKRELQRKLKNLPNRIIFYSDKDRFLTKLADQNNKLKKTQLPLISNRRTENKENKNLIISTTELFNNATMTETTSPSFRGAKITAEREKFIKEKIKKIPINNEVIKDSLFSLKYKNKRK